MTGKIRQIDFPIYYDYGVDDIGSCIDFLVSEKVWPKGSGTVTASTIGLEKMRTSKLIETIENSTDLHQQMIEEVGRVWGEIEESLKLHRKGRFS